MKIKVNFFQRKRIPESNYSVEFVFDDVRERLKNLIIAKTHLSTFYSRGIFKRLFNAIEVIFRQGEINHITGDIHFLATFMQKKRTLLTVLDCGFMYNRHGLTAFILKLFWLSIPVKKSKYITTISEYTKQDVIKYTNCDPEKIFVVPVAINERFKASPKIFNKQKPNLLQIGRAPNKNFERIVAAIDGLEVKLTIIGRLSPEETALLAKHKIDYENKYQLSDEEMVQEYVNADILVFPSTLEGFGMPILEAQKVGRAVLTANVTSMPEVAGDAACLVDPFSIEDIKSGLLNLIEDDTYRQGLISAGFENVKRFDPQIIAMMYFDLYQRMANENQQTHVRH